MKPCLIVLGPTATGKTRMSVKIAESFDGEIISADSRQVFKYMDLGTGKDLLEYNKIPYHLINIIHPLEYFSASDFQASAHRALDSQQNFPQHPQRTEAHRHR